MADLLLRPRGVISRARASLHWSNLLGWRQWLVLFGMGAAVIAIEVRNHNIMWREHQSGQTFWTDHMLVGEVFLFGLILPILAGIAIEYMGRTAIERDKIAKELEMRRQLVSQVKAAEGWHELAELVVKTPGAIVSANRAWLFAQRSGEEEFDQIASWEHHRVEVLPSSAPVSPAACEQCMQASSPKGTRILTCDHANTGNVNPYTRYCLWLSSEGQGKTALLFDMPSDAPLDANQMKVLNDLGDEITLAVDSANLHYVEQRQIDMAKDERLRIARDLHDSLGQNISVLRMKLEHLSDSRVASGSTAFQNELTSMLVVADEAYEQVRDTLEELRTTEHIDLEEAIRLYATQVAERAGFSADVRSIGQAVQLSPRQNRQIMYIVREALNNTEKHAVASQVGITLQWRDAEFELTMSDDGQGFEQELVNSEEHYGLSIIAERSRAMNADLVIESIPGKGTEVRLILPLSIGAQERRG